MTDKAPTTEPLREALLARFNDVTTYDARRREVAAMIEEADRQDDHPMGPDGLADALMEIALGWLRAALDAPVRAASSSLDRETTGYSALMEPLTAEEEAEVRDISSRGAVADRWNGNFLVAALLATLDRALQPPVADLDVEAMAETLYRFWPGPSRDHDWAFWQTRARNILAAFAHHRARLTAIPALDTEKEPWVKQTDPNAGPCPKCGHSASGITVGGEPRPHTCCGHPDCMTVPVSPKEPEPVGIDPAQFPYRHPDDKMIDDHPYRQDGYAGCADCRNLRSRHRREVVALRADQPPSKGESE